MKILFVIDMQNDFIDGSLGTKEAKRIVQNVVKKINSHKEDLIVATYDTHNDDYLKTLEGEKLPVPHCIFETKGWELNTDIQHALNKCKNVKTKNKLTFGYTKWDEFLNNLVGDEKIEEIEICGLCTDICVVSNALILRATYKDIPIIVDSTCCAGVSQESHKAALQTMKMCQIDII